MSYLLTSMEEVRKENEKRQRILELKEAIKKAEAEWNTSDVEKLKKELKGLTNESFLTKEQILNLHSQLINKFGGIDGVRDEGLLESALNNAYGVYFGLENYPTVEEKAARLAYSLTKNHPFLDGNKRIGVLIMLVFLEINKMELTCNNEELTDLGLKIAASQKSYEDILEFINIHKKDI